jgi:hypothetical protein
MIDSSLLLSVIDRFFDQITRRIWNFNYKLEFRVIKNNLREQKISGRGTRALTGLDGMSGEGKPDLVYLKGPLSTAQVI